MPSLALIGIAVPFTVLLDPQLGFKVLPTLIAIVALGIPPILVNTHAGITEVDARPHRGGPGHGPDAGARCCAASRSRWRSPVIVAGIGSAAVQIIATVTLGAIFGFGGLGAYLTEGISQGDDGMTFGGVVLVALLALAAECAVHATRPAGRGPRRRGRSTPAGGARSDRSSAYRVRS